MAARASKQPETLAMPLIVKRPRDILLYRSGVARTARSLSETVDQLQEQLRAAQQQIGAERNQHALTEARLKQENAVLTRELAEARLELARRDTERAFAAAPSPSSMWH
jgi:multidrug resistance efflux pump